MIIFVVKSQFWVHITNFAMTNPFLSHINNLNQSNFNINQSIMNTAEILPQKVTLYIHEIKKYSYYLHYYYLLYML